jgi:predicted ATPase
MRDAIWPACCPSWARPLEAEDSADPYGQARLLEAILLLVERSAERSPPLLLALEDIHWADTSTRSVLTYLSRSLGDAAVVLVVTYRSGSFDGSDDLSQLVMELDRAPNAERFELVDLGAAEVERQLAGIIGGPPGSQLLADVVARSGGNPFFVEELALTAAGPEADQVPPSIRQMIGARLARLDVVARSIVELVAAAGAPIAVRLVAQMLRLRDAAADAALYEAQQAYLVTVSSRDGADSVDVRHVLVRDAVIEVMPPLRRQQSHGLLAGALSDLPEMAGSSELERASLIAGHLVLSGADLEAIPALLEAARAAERARSFAAADRAYEQAMEAWRRLPQEARSGVATDVDILEPWATAAALAGHSERAAVLAQQARSRIDAVADRDRWLAVSIRLGRSLAQAGRTDRASQVLEETVEAAPGGSLERAR